MSITQRERVINPRLGNYFGIFASLFAALVMLLLIFEQLGASDYIIRLAMTFGPMALFAAIGIACAAARPADFFAAGRRVPAFFNGLVLGITALGGTGFVVLTGSFFIAGFDALFLVIGCSAGLVAMVVLIAPYVRKTGAYTLPSYFGRRFESNFLRFVAGILLLAPLLLLAAAEIRVGAYLASWLMGESESLAALVIAVVIAIPLILGGMRALTWSSAAKAIAAILALLVPVTVLASIVTNLPLAQMSHGPILRALGREEFRLGFAQITAAPLAFDLVGQDMALITKRFAAPFASIGKLSFVLAIFTVMAGIASSPTLLLRAGTTPGVYEARKSIGWAAVIFGITALTLSAVAVFMRDMVMDEVVGAGRDQLPIWFKNLVTMGVASLDGKVGQIAASSIAFKRDAVLFALPIAAGFPPVVVYLALAGALAAALAGGAAAVYAMGASLAEDLVFGFKWEPVGDKPRMIVARTGVALAAAIGGWAAIALEADPLNLLLWSLAISASAAFPVLVLSIWWKRVTKWGAAFGMATGFGVAVLVIATGIMSGDANLLGIDRVLAGVFGIPAGFAATIAVSLMTPMPGRNNMELIRDIRVPGGETVYDRDMRLLRLKRRQRG